jgi:hypothetical protein
MLKRPDVVYIAMSWYNDYIENQYDYLLGVDEAEDSLDKEIFKVLDLFEW